MALRISDILVDSFKYLFQETYHTAREMYIFGSRKSAKTKHIALRFILRAMTDKEYNALAMRKISSELDSSVKEELDWAIQVLGVAHLWTYKISKKTYTYLPYGNRILLKGISINPTSGKPSLSGLNIANGGNIKDVWLEEAWEFSYDDYKMIRQTVRGGLYTLLIIGNPYFQSMWCVKRAMELCPPVLETLKDKGEIWKYVPKSKDSLESVVHWNNFQINTKLSEYDLEERWDEERTNPKDFITTGYGFPGSPSGTILGDLTHNIDYITYEAFSQRAMEFVGGVDVGLTNDATACVFGAIDHNNTFMFSGEYYHSNGAKECNQFSNNGVWKHKDPTEIANDVIEFFFTFSDNWTRAKKTFNVYVDSADRAFIHILNSIVKEHNAEGLIKFLPTIGEKGSKKTIEHRIIFERQLLSRNKIAFVEIDKINTMKQLLYEMENLPWKITMSNQQAKAERDDSKVPDHITNAFEYAIRPYENKVAKSLGSS